MAKPDTIQPLGRTKHIFFGLHGPSSAGKTRFIATLPNTLILRPPIEHTESVKDPAPGVEEWVVKDWNEMLDDVLDYLRHEGKNHDFVWLDSISGWQDVGLDDVWEDTVAARPHRKKTPIDKGEYNANFVRLARFVRAAVGCDQFNFGFTAWPEELEDAETGDTKLMPWVQGKNMANRMVGYMKLVCYYERTMTGPKDNRKMVRVLRWSEQPNIYTKDQIGLPEKGFMVNPTMPKLMEEIKIARARTAAADRARARTSPARRKTTARRPIRRTPKKGSK